MADGSNNISGYNSHNTGMDMDTGRDWSRSSSSKITGGSGTGSRQRMKRKDSAEKETEGGQTRTSPTQRSKIPHEV